MAKQNRRDESPMAHTEEKIVDRFLRRMAEKPEYKESANQLLQFLKETRDAAKALLEDKKVCMQKIEELLELLPSAQKEGRTAWERVRAKVGEILKFKDFWKEFPPDWDKKTFTADDGTWWVFLQREEGEASYKIYTQLLSPKPPTKPS